MTVGSGAGGDYAASVGLARISSATGSFANVSAGITETGQYDAKGPQLANTFGLQLNTRPFATAACSGVNGCRGWQQFVYDSYGHQVYIEYWQLNYTTSCPSGWTAYPNGSEGDCYTNSPANSAAPALTAAGLATAQLTGTAVAGGNDEVLLASGGQATSVIYPDSVLGLASQWNAVEFNVGSPGMIVGEVMRTLVRVEG